MFISINPFKSNFKFFKWRIYLRIVKDSPPRWLEQVMLDAYLYGEGIVRVGPEEFRLPSPLTPPERVI